MPLSELNDETLLSLLKEDGREAFSIIYRKYWPDLYDMAYKRTQNEAQCQDILQNVFADLWLRRHQLKITNLAAFLHTAVRFQLYKQIARAPKYAMYLDEFEEIISSPVYADDHLREKEILELVNLWLTALPEKRRKIFLMHYTEDLSTREIAEILGISQNTVQAQLYTANQSLRARLASFMSLSIVLGFML